MRMLPIAVVIGAAVLIPAASSPAKSSCGSFHGGFEHTIVAYGLSCTDARKVVKAWDRKSVPGNPGTKVVGSYHCVSTATDLEHVRVVCTNVKAHSRRVTFYAGP